MRFSIVRVYRLGGEFAGLALTSEKARTSVSPFFKPDDLDVKSISFICNLIRCESSGVKFAFFPVG